MRSISEIKENNDWSIVISLTFSSIFNSHMYVVVNDLMRFTEFIRFLKLIHNYQRLKI